MTDNKKTEKESKTETKSFMILKEIKVAKITTDEQPKIPEPSSKNIKKNESE